MVVLLDANVVMNHISGRDDRYLHASREIVTLCGQGKLDGYIAFHSVSIIWYAMKIPSAQKRLWLKDVCSVLTVVGASHEQVMDAIENENFRDFEDCLQDECAQRAHADFLITCNKKDFRTAKSNIVTPDEFLEIFSAPPASLQYH